MFAAVRRVCGRSGGLVAREGEVVWFFLQYTCQMVMVGCEIKVNRPRLKTTLKKITSTWNQKSIGRGISKIYKGRNIAL